MFEKSTCMGIFCQRFDESDKGVANTFKVLCGKDEMVSFLLDALLHARKGLSFVTDR
jgi:hypothetical protein